MFAVTFDDFKRRVERKNPNMEIKALCTAYMDTPDWNAYWNVLESGANDKLHIHMEVDPPNLGTFFIVTEKKTEKEKVEA